MPQASEKEKEESTVASSDSAEAGGSHDKGTPQDIRFNLEKAVRVVIELNDNLKRAEPIAAAVDELANQKMSKAPLPTGPDDNPCGKPSPAVTPFCSALSLGRATADLTYKQSCNTAAGALYTAVNTWEVALLTYDSAIADATAKLDAAVATAYLQYGNSLKSTPDAISRARYLWWVLKGAVVAGITTYETAVQTAAGNLAAAAGEALKAYTTYVSAINLAMSARLATDATVEQTFWQNVETSRDS